MKRQSRLAIVCVAAVFLAFAVILAILQSRQSPHQSLLKELDVSNVEYISIYKSSGEAEARLSEDDVPEVVQLLNMVNLTGAGTQDYADQFSLRRPMFHICLKDGKEFDFSAWYPYFIINTKTFGEAFGYSLNEKNVVTGSGYRVLRTADGYYGGSYGDYNYNVCVTLRITYNNLCRAYLYR